MSALKKHDILCRYGRDVPILIRDELPKDIEGTLAYLMCRLTDRERMVLNMQYRSGMSLTQIGGEFGVPRERIRQLSIGALKKLGGNEDVLMMRYGIGRYFTEKDAESAKASEQAILKEIERLSDKIDALGLTGLHPAPAQPETGAARKDGGRIPDTNILIEDLWLSTRSYNCLHSAGCVTVEDILQLNADKLMEIKNLGRTSAKEIVNRLGEWGYDVTVLFQ